MPHPGAPAPAEPAGYFLKNALANHHLLVRGDHAGLIDDFMRYAGASRIK